MEIFQKKKLLKKEIMLTLEIKMSDTDRKIKRKYLKN